MVSANGQEPQCHDSQAPELSARAPLLSNVPRRLQLTLAGSTAMGNGEYVGETRLVGDNGFIGRLR
jgi:hypothetical protein